MKRPRAACTGALAIQFRGEGLLLVVIVVLILAGAGAAAAALAAAQVRQIELQLPQLGHSTPPSSRTLSSKKISSSQLGQVVW